MAGYISASRTTIVLFSEIFGATMLGRAGTAYAKKASKFEDSDSSHTSRPRY
jgi:hypothetical protein